MEPTLSDVERLLRGAHPRPRPEFVRELEASLIHFAAFEPVAAPPRRSRQLRRLLVGVSFAGALAVLMVVLAIAGVRPLGTSGTTGAAADHHCVTVQNWALVRRPRLVVSDSGRLAIVTRTELALQPHIRCR